MFSPKPETPHLRWTLTDFDILPIARAAAVHVGGRQVPEGDGECDPLDPLDGVVSSRPVIAGAAARARLTPGAAVLVAATTAPN